MAVGLVKRVVDGLANVITGGGTGADKNAYARYTMQGATMTQMEVEAAYRTSWIVRKMHDLPPFDATRKWRDWQGDADQIKALKAEEGKHGLRKKTMEAMTWARLYGGAALIMGLPGDPARPVNIAACGLGALRYIHVVNRWQVTIPDLDMDPESEFFGQPVRYEMRGATREVRIHPSRVIPFIGQPVPQGMQTVHSQDLFWGDPLLQSVRDAPVNADQIQAGIAALMQEAKIDTVSIPGLMSHVGTAEYEDRLMRRLSLVNLSKSIHHTRIIDGDEKWETQQINFTGMADILKLYLQIAAGAADIPATRFLSQSPQGMNATGDSDLENYYDMIEARQDVDLRPRLERIDAVLIPSALGDTAKATVTGVKAGSDDVASEGVADADDGISWAFAPLQRADPKDLATIEKTRADTFTVWANSGLIPDTALAKTAQNVLVESEQYPGLEAALAEAEAAGDVASITEEPDPSALATDPVTGKPIAAPVAARPAPAKAKTKPKATKDAEPRTLYVSRKVQNASEIIAWAKGQGFKSVIAAADLHVTVAFSRAPVDWMALGQAWGVDPKGVLNVPPGGPRIVEKFSGGAVVLEFASSDLSWRHMSIREAGASWDFETYTPHITITYDLGDLDLETVEPYRGKITLGPEVFAEVDEGWKASVVEEGA